MSIVAALDKVLFFNASSKYSVLRMKTEDSSVPTEARSPYRYHDHLIRFTAVGIELPQTDTVKIEMDGEWKDGRALRTKGPADEKLDQMIWKRINKSAPGCA